MDFYTAVFLLCLVAGSLAIPGPIDLFQDLMDKTKYSEVKGYFRIEALILRMENPRGTTMHWTPCDVFPGSCDPKITAAIDYYTPNYDSGKDSVPYGNYQLIWDGKGATNIEINKILSKDVCNHSTRKVNVRIRAMDKDTLRDDTIDRFSCMIYTTDPPVASEKDANWSEEKICTGHNSAHKIHWKYRWFFVADSDCKETAGSSGWLRRYTPFLGK